MEASIKYRFSVGLLVTLLAVVSTALTLHLHLKVEQKILHIFDVYLRRVLYINVQKINVRNMFKIFLNTFYYQDCIYGDVCTMKFYE